MTLEKVKRIKHLAAQIEGLIEGLTSLHAAISFGESAEFVFSGGVIMVPPDVSKPAAEKMAERHEGILAKKWAELKELVNEQQASIH